MVGTESIEATSASYTVPKLRHFLGREESRAALLIHVQRMLGKRRMLEAPHG